MALKVAFDIFGFVLDFALDDQCDGTSAVRRVVADLPGRRWKPHLTLFADEHQLDLHFTARHGRPDVFRRKLERVNADRVVALLDRYAAVGVAHYVAALNAVDLQAWEDDGWSVHGANFDVLARWLQIVYRRERVFRLDGRVATSIAEHVVRQRIRPTSLLSLPPEPRRLLALRAVNDEIEARPLVFFPDGYGVEKDDGSIYLAHPPGWYTHPFSVVPPNVDHQVLPIDRVARVGRKIDKYLSYFPPRDRIEALHELEDLPTIVSTIVAYYSTQVMQVAFGVAHEAGAS